jgi:hypothetical protein
MAPDALQMAAAVIFAIALLHTFSTKLFERMAHRTPRHAGLLHLLGEVEVVFGFWAFVLLVVMALLVGGGEAIAYAESRQYTEPLFVFVVMVIAASRPIMNAVERSVAALASRVRGAVVLARVWLSLALVPLLGSLITEPAAMTLAALMLQRTLFAAAVPERLKYAALGVLFVNVSIGGTLTSFAAPPVLMVAATWGWDSLFMASTFGWRAAIAVLINATVVCYALRRYLPACAEGDDTAARIPPLVTLIHFAFLSAVVIFAHHPVIFLGLFLFFLGYIQAYSAWQSAPILKEGLLVGFFLAGLVVLGGMQQWWLQPLISSLSPTALFIGAVGLTAITDNAALTYLGSLIPDLADSSKYLLVAGAVAGGGLTVIANAPNPAGVALLKRRFLLGALPPTLVAVAMFLI